jgi:hypothetical protein
MQAVSSQSMRLVSLCSILLCLCHSCCPFLVPFVVNLAADLALCSIHKDLAKSLMPLLASGEEGGSSAGAADDEAIVALVRGKTTTLIEALRSLFPIDDSSLPSGFTPEEWSMMPSHLADLFVTEEQEAPLAAAFNDKLKASGIFGNAGGKAEVQRFCWAVSKAEGLHHLAQTA